MSIFDKIKFKNKNNVAKLREQFLHKEIGLADLPQDVLIELFICAVSRIDRLENKMQERDFKDIWCDQEFIVDDLFKELEERIRLDIYE